MTHPPAPRRPLLLATALLAVSLAVAAVPSAAGAPAKRVELTGRLEITHGDEFGDHRSHAHDSVPGHVLPNMQYWLHTDSKRLALEFPGHPPPAEGGTRVTVRGERHGGAIHVAGMQTAAAAGGNGRKKPPPQPTTAYLGVRDVIVIPFTFQGISPPWTVEEIRANTFTGTDSVANFFAENSFGATTLKGKNDGLGSADPDGATGDVSNWVTINASTSSCSYSTWSSAAQTLVKQAGWDLTGYEHIAHVFPRQSACGWSGLAQLPGTQTWMNGTIHPGVITHELGHNVTLYHARSLSCTGSDGNAVTVSNSCSYSEYGDPFDTMGHAWNYMHENVRNKGHLSWMTGTSLATGVSGGTYTLQPLEQSSPGLQLLRIPRGTRGDYLYVEARTGYGFDAYQAHGSPTAGAPTSDVLTGALIHTGPDLAANGNSYVLDTAPFPMPKPEGYAYAPEFLDAALQPGEQFVDTQYGIAIEVTGRDLETGAVTVVVRTGVSNTAPAAQAAAAAVTATDSTKNLSSYRWSWVSCPASCPPLSDAQGQLSGGSDDVPAPSYTPTGPGTYRLSVTVRDAAGATGSTQVEHVV